MLKLQAEKRIIFGKNLEADRKNDRLPVVVYGRKEKPVSLFVSSSDFKKVLREAGESTLVNLITPEGDKSILIHEVAYHPVNREPIHADFYVVEQDVAIRIEVAIEYQGVSGAVKELGGTLVKVLHELEVEALPKDLPHRLIVDISSLATLDSQILVRDLVLPPRVKVINRPEEVVAAISVAEEEKEEVATVVDLSSIEVEKRGKEIESEESEGETVSADK